MDYFTTTGTSAQRAVDCVIVGVYEGGKLGKSAAELDAASGGVIRKQLKSNDIQTQPGRCSVLTNLPGVRAPRAPNESFWPLISRNIFSCSANACPLMPNHIPTINPGIEIKLCLLKIFLKNKRESPFMHVICKYVNTV